MRRRFFKRRVHRIPYNVIMVVALLTLAAALVVAIRLLLPSCMGL